MLIHLTRPWTALFPLARLGAAFVYKPEWLTLYLRTTMTAIETGAAALPARPHIEARRAGEVELAADFSLIPVNSQCADAVLALAQ
jgi:hypothetical protein